MKIKRRDLISAAVGAVATIVVGGAIVGFSGGEHGWGDDHRGFGDHRMGHDGDFGGKLGMSNRPLGPGDSGNNGMMGGPGQNPGGPANLPAPAPTK
jgi:hypothetical protein